MLLTCDEIQPLYSE